MSRRKKRKPAHEVIMERIEKACEDISTPRFEIGVFYMLCEVMKEMVIPKDRFAEVISQLKKAKSQANHIIVKRWLETLIRSLAQRKRWTKAK